MSFEGRAGQISCCQNIQTHLSGPPDAPYTHAVLLLIITIIVAVLIIIVITIIVAVLNTTTSMITSPFYLGIHPIMPFCLRLCSFVRRPLTCCGLYHDRAGEVDGSFERRGNLQTEIRNNSFSFQLNYLQSTAKGGIFRSQSRRSVLKLKLYIEV